MTEHFVEIAILTFTIGLVVALFILFIWQVSTNRRAKALNNKLDESTDILFSYLNEEKDLSEIERFLQEKSINIVAFISIIQKLIKDLEGDLKVRLQDILQIPIVERFYFEKLDSSELAEKADALIFYKMCKDLPAETIEKLEEHIFYDHEDLIFGASLALLESGSMADKKFVLEEICKREDFSIVSFWELIISFNEGDGTGFDEKREIMLELLNSDEVMGKFKYALVIALGELNYMNLTRPLYDYLQEERKKSRHNERLIGTIIETLSKLFYIDVIKEIVEILPKSESSTLKLSCMRALGNLDNEDSIGLLKNLLTDKDPFVRHEAIIQIQKINPSFLKNLHMGATLHKV